MPRSSYYTRRGDRSSIYSFHGDAYAAPHASYQRTRSVSIEPSNGTYHRPHHTVSSTRRRLPSIESDYVVNIKKIIP
jgi:hypothetical protein